MAENALEIVLPSQNGISEQYQDTISRYERPKERGWDAMQPNRKIGEKQDEMGRPLGKNGCKQTSKESRGGKTSITQEKGKATAEMGGLREEGHEKIGGG